MDEIQQSTQLDYDLICVQLSKLLHREMDWPLSE